jgi:hypothetical protein
MVVYEKGAHVFFSWDEAVGLGQWTRLRFGARHPTLALMEFLKFAGVWDAQEPVAFACAYAPAPRGGPEALLACVYGWGGPDLAQAKAAPWEAALEAWGWRGGALENDGLDDFVALGAGAVALLESGAREPGAWAEALACLGRGFFKERWGAPSGEGPCAWWIDDGAGPVALEERAALAKRAMMARWQALRIEQASGAAERLGPLRI